MSITSITRPGPRSGSTLATPPLSRTLPQARQNGAEAGFSLAEMLVAITVTLIIMGSVYGLMAQGQNAFGREPLIADRQQQIRLAMDRIQDDIVSAGLGLGGYAQTFAPGLNGVGPLGVRVAGDAALGGGLSDHLEIRSRSAGCPTVRTAVDPNVPGTSLAGEKLQTVEPIPDCFPDPGWVFLLYPNGWSKYGWLSNHPAGTDNQSTFANPQPDGSQVGGDNAGPAHVLCSIWFGNQNNLASPNGGPPCPPLLPWVAAAPAPAQPQADPQNVSLCPNCDPYGIHQADFVRYQIGNDVDGAIGLFRSSTGGFDLVGGAPTATNPPGAQWQLVARGIEDLQVEYRSLNSGVGWINSPVLITNDPAIGLLDVVQEVRITLWSRVVGERPQPAGNPGDNISGESRAAGNQVMAVRGALVSRIAPRAGQDALAANNDLLWK